MKVLGRDIEMFRTRINPMIGPVAKQAFMPKDMNMQVCKLTDIGIYCKLKDGLEHVVPYANVESIRLTAGDK